MENENIIYVKEEGIIESYPYSDQLEEKLNQTIDGYTKTLCWTCSNGFITKCQKIRDLQKQVLESYEYIIDGYQIIKNDKMIQFNVLKCENYCQNLTSEKSKSKTLKKGFFPSN
ncbi:MAG: hypothetical protein IJ093_02005 [Bacilli bacterium]|nr:hypothetical protein [Bacilli bacterium]